MDKSPNIFLKGEIQRIINLNERIEASSFLLEALDTTTTANINDIRKFLLKRNVKKENVDLFINDVLIDPI